MTDQEKAKLSIDLIYRAKDELTRFADAMVAYPGCPQGKTIEQAKFERCMDLMDKLMDFGFFDPAPDENWFRDYYTLTGDHVVLTEEGWIPADQNTVEITGEEPMEILDEVNAP
jgi:hypothetical protein